MPRTPDPFDDASSDDAPLDWSEAEQRERAPDPFDMVDAIDDEGGTLDLGQEPARSSTPVSAPIVSDDGGDEDPFEPVGRTRSAGPAPPSPEPEDARPIVPYNTTAVIAGQLIPALLAPSMPSSTWRGAPEGAAGAEHTVELAGMRIQARFDCLPGAPLLVLGRDVIAGRLLVEV